MNKAQRLDQARRMLADVDEGSPRLICQEVAAACDLSYDEVSDLYWRPLHAVYAAAQKADRATHAIRGTACHYCGLQATHWDGFDVPVCDECG